jgi:hypothetical protein
MKVAPWFDPKWQARYARLLAEMRKLEELARAAGRKLTP